MNKKQAEELTNDVLIADVLLRLKTLENLLLAKGVFTQEEYDAATAEIAAKIAKTILQRANVPGDLDELIKGLQGNKPKPSGN
jgi:TPP-dependent pyruvate/acetoin dehydrogenase alpha subunit